MWSPKFYRNSNIFKEWMHFLKCKLIGQRQYKARLKQKLTNQTIKKQQHLQEKAA